MALSSLVRKNEFLNVFVKVQAANSATTKQDLMKWWSKEKSIEAKITWCVGAILNKNSLLKELDWEKLPLMYMSLVLNGVKEVSAKNTHEFIDDNLDKLKSYKTSQDIWNWIFLNYDNFGKDLKNKLQPLLHSLPKELYSSAPNRIHMLETISSVDIPLLLAAASNAKDRQFHKDLDFPINLINTLESLELNATQMNREISNVIMGKFSNKINQNHIPENLFENY